MNAKKVVITNKGPVDNIILETYTIPVPKDNQVLIQVEYAGLAYADIMLRKISMPGLPKPPFTPGADLVGVVTAVGQNVVDFNVGDRVTGLMMSDFGAQAEYVVVDHSKVRHIPEDIPSETALCLLINYLTAYQMLESYKMTESYKTLISNKQPTLLIHGGSGGVGSALVQLAIAQNMKVLATCSTTNVAFVESMGTEVIDYKKIDFVKHIQSKSQSVDVVFDPIGGDYTKRSVKVLADKGAYISYGFQGGIRKGMFGIMQAFGTFFWQKLIHPALDFAVFQLNQFTDEENLKCMNALYAMVRESKIGPAISDIFPVEHARVAHESLEHGNRRGKILIQFNSK